MKYYTEQITNHDINDKESTYHMINVPTKEGTQIVQAEYKIVLTDYNTIKFSYCCEEKAFYYPIFIKNKDDEDFTEIKLSKNCIFELTPHTIEKDPDEALEKQVIIVGIQVPTGVRFTLDYTRVG